MLLDDDDNVRDIPEKTAAPDARLGGSVPHKRKMEPQDIEATAGTAVPFPSMDTDEQQLVQMIGKLAVQHAWAVHEALARTMLQVCKVEVTLNKIRISRMVSDLTTSFPKNSVSLPSFMCHAIAHTSCFFACVTSKSLIMFAAMLLNRLLTPWYGKHGRPKRSPRTL